MRVKTKKKKKEDMGYLNREMKGGGGDKSRIKSCSLLQIFLILFCAPLYILFGKKKKKKKRREKRKKCCGK